MRFVGDILILVLTIVVAAVVGLGVPVGWLWIGSQLQGDRGVSSLDFSVAAATLIGIILTYGLVLYIAGWLTIVLGERVGGEEQTRSPWMKGMTESGGGSRRAPELSAIERIFIYTTLLVTVGFGVWFFAFAGSPLPNQ